jgi:hypothetical protein
MFNLKLNNMKRKVYLLTFLCLFGITGLFAQDTLHVGEGLNALVQAADPGATIIIASGLHDAQDVGIEVTKSLTIKGAAGEQKPLVYINQFDINGTDIDFKLEGIEFSGACLVDSLTGEENIVDSVPRSYLINLVSGHQSCGNIVIRNCLVRNFERSAIRGDRSANTADSIIVDNSILHDFRGGGDYGPFRFKDDITFSAFVIRNSTLYDFMDKLIDNQDTPAGTEMDIRVENCTFYAWGGGKADQYLFDIQDDTDARLYINSCIFGKTNYEGDSVRAFRFLDDAYAEITNTAFAPDFIVALPGSYGKVNWDLDEWNEVDLDPEFDDPDAGNFTLPEESPLRQMSPTGGPIGDPRWATTAEVGTGRVRTVSAMHVYPNPATGVINIKVEGPCTGAIYNTMGIKVMDLNIRDESVYTVDVSGFAPGLYMVKLDKNLKAQRFLVK